MSFADHVPQCMVHVLSGLKHLALLVVLASDWGRRQLLWALSISTVGHATTLKAAAAAANGVRLALVFACALIHGLGLAGALGDLGLDLAHRLWSLAGFNAGIEAGQLVVALAAVAAFAGIRHFSGRGGLALTTRLTSYAAMAAGSLWLAQRVVVAA